MKTRPQKSDGWKVEPLPAAVGVANEDLTVPELAALLAEACRRIRVLEVRLGHDAA